MKSLLQISIFFFIASVLLLPGCSTEPVNPENKRLMTARIDGSDWAAVQFSEIFYVNDQFQIKGVSEDGSSIQILLLAVNEARDYSVGTAVSGNIAIYRVNESQQWTTNSSVPSGIVDLSVINEEEAKGTFFFTVTDGATTKKITDGIFDVSFATTD